MTFITYLYVKYVHQGAIINSGALKNFSDPPYEKGRGLLIIAFNNLHLIIAWNMNGLGIYPNMTRRNMETS